MVCPWRLHAFFTDSGFVAIFYHDFLKSTKKKWSRIGEQNFLYVSRFCVILFIKN
jgi:hypothetical protein